MAARAREGGARAGSLCLAAWLLISLSLSPAAASSLTRKTVLDSPIRDTQWVGPSDEIVLTLTEAGHVWLSKDGGLTWKDQSEAGLVPGGLDASPAHGVYEPPKGVQALYFHPSAPAKIFFRGGSNVHWVSHDYGDTYEKVEGPDGHLGVATIRLHPTEPDWILAMARRWACWSRETTARGDCADDLFLTTDFGKTWKNLTEAAQGRILGFVDFDWGWSKNPDAPKHPTSYTKDTILAAVFENRAEVREHLARSGVGVVAGWDKYVDFVRTTDYFRTPHEQAVPCGNQFEIMADKLFLAVADHCGTSGQEQPGVKLKVSTDYGGSFVDACFPELFTERGYSVVYANDHTAFMNVDYNSGPRMSTSGDLLSSDESVSLFSVVMHRNARSITGVVDFAAVQAIPGVYIANQVSETENEPVHHVGTEEEDVPKEYARSTTMISFNGGGAWQPLSAPEYDANRKPIECARKFGCSLHLHGTTSWIGGGGFAFVYSHPSTPGLVISTGNVGSYLYQDSTVNTYLSRDAGRTWEEIAKGAHIYEFGDSGGVIVMTKHGLHTATDTLLYSLDEGLNWEEERFTTGEAVDIYNIRVEPDNQGKKFVIQGLSTDNGDGRPRVGVLITMDFEQLDKFKECSSSDYEDWEPSTDGCLLGQTLTLQRQRRAATCWNGNSYKRPEPRMSPCTCTPSDYQCDFGLEGGDFLPVSTPEHVGKCYPVEGFSPERACERDTLARAGLVSSTDGRRKVAGNRCKGDRPQFQDGVGPARGQGSAGSRYSGGSSGSSSSSSSFWGGGGSSSSSSSSSSPGSSSSHGLLPAAKDEPAHHSGWSRPDYGSSSTASNTSGGSSIWSWLWSIFLFLLFVAAAVLGLAFLAYKGYLPDWVLRYVPFLENMRYHSMRSNFSSLAQDFGLSGGDDDYEEMYRRP